MQLNYCCRIIDLCHLVYLFVVGYLDISEVLWHLSALCSSVKAPLAKKTSDTCYQRACGAVLSLIS